MFENVDLMTALVTPFNDDNQIDYQSLEKLANHLINTGSRGFVIGATTGETPTLSMDEKIELYTKFSRIIHGRVPIIAGVGTNNTAETIKFTQRVSKIKGINVALIVVPYYNKPDQRGMINHFTKVADEGGMPTMIYNIPGRTGKKMDNDTIIKLSHHKNIIGVKQCGTMEDMENLVEHVDKNFMIYSGEDAQALFAKVIGANGVISVASHIYGPQMRQMYDAIEKGDVKTAGHLQRLLTPKMAALFMYASPEPTKAVLNAQGWNVGGCRLPLESLNNEEKEKLANRLGLSQDALLKSLPKELKL
ncbi:4-hydroxy-tetrahydrodipicolinate synthase [Philodulcilactobacillus myokoensis]|uniref:4-hydroxy-tetrahydrodipicolinate synthase n=2 Tax=Philodulcilactobacillus myokoensis TaxID=2929573 RepID=A0A9W6B0U0_9LACO|nr:4-hydroxy-tetrahydrodipicolinate synthase [Philodulcilactobacillus myokoensis]